jgi:hypothetical protein
LSSNAAEPAQAPDAADVTRTARCACGACSLRAAGLPQQHAVCHCTNCKRRTGSAFGISAYFRRDQVTGMTGDMRVYRFHHVTLKHDQARHFCGTCGSTLWWTVSSLPDLIGVAGGCFGEDMPGAPSGSVAPAQQCAWVTLPPAWAADALPAAGPAAPPHGPIAERAARR